MKSFLVFSALLCSVVLAQQVSVQSSLMRGVDARGIREDPDKYKNVTELSTCMHNYLTKTSRYLWIPIRTTLCPNLRWIHLVRTTYNKRKKAHEWT
jgi:hypothetical protein